MRRDPRFGERLIMPDGTTGNVCELDMHGRRLRIANADFSSGWLTWEEMRVPRISEERLQQIAAAAFSAAARERLGDSPLADLMLDHISLEPSR